MGMLSTVREIAKIFISPAAQRPTQVDNTAPVRRINQRPSETVESPVMRIDRSLLQSMSTRTDSKAKPAA